MSLVEQLVDAVHDDLRHPFELGPVFFLGFPGEEFKRFRDAKILQSTVHGQRLSDTIGDDTRLREG